MNKLLWSYIMVLLMLSSCSVKKFIPEGETLYVGSELELEGATDVPGMKSVVSDLEAAIRPKPNSTILGMRLGLYVHFKAQREKPGFLNKFLNKRIGEKPVYESAVNTTETEKILLNRLENRGFFMSEASSEIIRKEKKKQAGVVYTLQVAQPYLMEKLEIDRDSLEIYNAIEALMNETLLQPESRFELSLLKKERERIDIKLKTEGYYNFNSEFLIFESDTSRYDSRKFDLYLRLKRETPSESVVPYVIKKINVYPNYVIENDSITQT
ncbi:MAG TPA: hypothetical protein VFD80_07505, partial [Flavobacteriaceae bacterium]|nr:hypothetical protein [Flavobacteriaceae bacterium]